MASVASFALVCILIVTAGQVGTLFPQFRLSEFRLGEPAPRELVVDRSVTYVDEPATDLRREAVAQLVSPVFVVNREISDRVFDRLGELARIVTRPEAADYSAEKLFLELQAALPGVVPRELAGRIAGSGNVLSVVNEVRIMLEQITGAGIVSESDLEQVLPTETVTIRRHDGDGPTELDVAVSSVVRLEQIQQYVLARTALRNVSEEVRQLTAALVYTLAEENAFFSEDLTNAAVRSARAEVRPVVRRLARGERIVREGEVITETALARIAAFAEFSTGVDLSKIAGTVLLVVLLYAAGCALLSPPISPERLQRKFGYLIVGSSVIYVAVAVLLLRVTSVPEFIPFSVMLPTALMAMLVAILTSPRVGVSFSLVLAGAILVLTQMDPVASLFALGSGMAGSLVVIGAEKRLDLIRASIYLSVANAVVVVVLGLYQDLTLRQTASTVGWAALNGLVSGILNLGIMPFLEHLLNAATPFRLIELSDLNSPILKKMLTLAPGTYQHSVAVANLAESACRDIGANPLLARVGAYYHDIGKIDQPEYFVENQANQNKHDELKPSLSVAVIKSHVKIGVERAKELGLPEQVVNVIAQHHGSGLISYFYQQAVKSADGTQIAPEDYSYTGTPPVSREAAVVMLADGVEAASRTLKKPTVSKLEKFVWKTILDRFTSEQMSNCELTFRDLDLIKKSFVHILAGQFHSRIEYPEQEDGKIAQS